MTLKEKTNGAGPYILTFLLIIAGYAVLFGSHTFQSSKVTSYDIPNSVAADSDSAFTVEISSSKHWVDTEHHADHPVGAQYDGVITNIAGENLQNWEIVLEVPENAFIDSSWNGRYRIQDGNMYITPVSYNETITAEKQETFGFVMYSDKVIEFDHIVLKGQALPLLYHSPFFLCLLVATLLWLLSTVSHINIKIRTAKYIQKQKEDTKIIIQSMSTFANMIDAKDPYTKGHSTRVALYASELARRMRLTRDEVNTLYYVALLHDCGKIGIPDAVLKKPERLTDTEWHLIQSHTTLGSNVLIDFTAIKGIRDGALYHHERYDGKGYPSGLKGEEIPLYARIICIADSYDAMSSNRCYREKIEKQKILNELISNAGTQFDPEIVKHMVDMVNDGFTALVQEKTRIYSFCIS